MPTLEGTAAQYLSLYENIQKTDPTDLPDLFDEAFRFKDPFNDFCGVECFARLLAKTKTDVIDPQFVVTSQVWDDRTLFVKWRFSGTIAVLKNWQVTGISEIVFNDKNLVVSHTDYWDASEYFYGRLPLIGLLIRLLRRRLQVD
jgi:hypothetical protein